LVLLRLLLRWLLHDTDNNHSKMQGRNRKQLIERMATKTPAAIVEAAMKSSSIEKGHRLGNYHNYYFHHPPSNRIDVLEEQGLIDCIACRLLTKEDSGHIVTWGVMRET
jgi:hypothetical protein